MSLSNKLMAMAGLLCLASGSAALAQGRTQGFALEGAVIDSRSGDSLGVVSERGDLSAVFKAQKTMTFGILRAAGISLDQLSPEVRAKIERFQTSNVEAFRAFSQGLDLKDQGRFSEARDSFKRAAELDPGFGLAVEQQQSMPDVNVSTALQLRAVMQAAAGAAVERGKVAYVVDLSRALAALQSGLTVVTVPAVNESAQRNASNEYTSNQAGSTANALPNQVVSLSLGYDVNTTNPRSLTSPSVWRGAEVRATGGTLEQIRTDAEVVADRGGAAAVNSGQATLSDGTVAYWGSWLSTPGGSAAVRVSGQLQTAPSLGQVDYVFADATRTMPGPATATATATATFTPAGGLLQGVSGNIAVDFAARSINLQNLGFQIGSLAFTGLNGTASYEATAASGAFNGRYSSGACSGCAAFTPTSSVFNGNFVGTQANGLAFSTLLNTGNGIASGVHLFTRP